MGIWGCLFIVLLWLAVMGLYRLLDPHPNACIGTAVTFGLLFLMAWLVSCFVNNLNKSLTSYIVGSSCLLEESHDYWTAKSTTGACRRRTFASEGGG